MVIAKRELYILIAVVVLGVGAILYAYVIDPYFTASTAIAADSAKLKADIAEDKMMFLRYQSGKKGLKDMEDHGGLQDNSELVEAQTIGAILAWSQLAAVDVSGERVAKQTKEGNFIVLNYDFTFSGPMTSISKLLWALENSPIPLRISELQITPSREGVDDLVAHMAVSALSRAPVEQAAPSNQHASAAADTSGGTRL